MPKIWSRRTVAMPLSVTAIWCLVVYALFLWVARSEADHVRELALSQARTLFTQLVSTRAWNAMYGGVFVLESERGRPNLDLPENRRAVETSEGMRLIRVNPAYMTRQIAEIVNSRQGVTFHITSLDPVRAANAPDAWETAALHAFRNGEKEVFALCDGSEAHGPEEHGCSEQHFRYMAPLLVDSTCWDCHYVEPTGILRPDRPQETYKLKAMGTGDGQTNEAQTGESVAGKTGAEQGEARSPLALGQVPQGDELRALAEACPEVEPSAEVDGNALTTVSKIPTLRGGISVSMAAGPLLAVEAGRVRILAMAYGGIGLLGVIGIGGATLLMSRRQAMAEAANRTKGTFLANMSHDMRTPLAGMLGMVELMQSPRCTNDKRVHYLHMLRGSAESLLEIVNDITDFSRLEAKKMSLCLGPFAVRDEVGTVVDLFRFACEQKGLALNVHVDANVPEVLVGDAFRLRQALGNLLANAVKFTDRGRIDVTVHVLEWHEKLVVHFGVRDTGRGIADEEHERIFDSFVQSATSRQNPTHSGGSGLGLAIVRDIARLFDGQAGVESQLRMGSFFWFTVCLTVPCEGDTRGPSDDLKHGACPENKEHSTAQGLPTDTHGPQTGAQSSITQDFTILVADDNTVVRLFFYETLSQAGYTVLLAEHGEAAIDILRRHIVGTGEQACHMALLDVRMPRQSGVELLRSIRAGKVLGVAVDMPIYMVTASALCDEEELRGSADADGVVLKPLQASALLELVDGVYRNWRTGMGCVEGDVMAEETKLETRLDIGQDAGQKTWDKTAALQGLDHNEALLRVLITAFIPEARARRERVLEALTEPCLEHVRILREEAHALANSAGVLCCGELLRSAKSLEMLAVRVLEGDADAGSVDTTEVVEQAGVMVATLNAVLVDLEAVLASAVQYGDGV